MVQMFNIRHFTSYTTGSTDCERKIWTNMNFLEPRVQKLRFWNAICLCIPLEPESFSIFKEQ